MQRKSLNMHHMKQTTNVFHQPIAEENNQSEKKKRTSKAGGKSD